MSWFFGKKKNKESPSEPGDEASSAANQSDDYVIVEKTSDPSPISFDNRNNPTPSFGLYPFIGGTDTGAPSPPIAVSQMDVLSDGQSYLNCIKFRLDRKFESDTDMDRLRADEILSFILRMKNEDYDYDFSLENSVINEMGINVE